VQTPVFLAILSAVIFLRAFFSGTGYLNGEVIKKKNPALERGF